MPISIDHSACNRQFITHLVVIENDNINTTLFRSLQSVETCHATIDRDDKLCALVNQRADCIWVWAIAFNDTVWNIDAGLDAKMGQEAIEHRR